MNLEILKEYKPRLCDYEECKEFSILLPIVNYNGQQCMLFQVRSEKLLKQPNEICFPGGKIEYDESPLKAAIRETSEELLICEESIELLGEIDTLVTPFNTIIYPFAAFIHDYNGTFSENEVQEVFYVPLNWLKNYVPQCSYLDVNMAPHVDFPFEKIQYGRNYPWAKGTYPVYFYTYEGKNIWGITARVLRNFISLIKENSV